MNGRVLIIAGSDPSGGAGIQADIKTVTALGGYAMAAITALTVQDTKGVYDVMPVPAGFVRQQIKTALKDIGADAIKIGMIGNVEIGQAILDGLNDAGWNYQGGHCAGSIPLVLDPVLAATSGDVLADGGIRDFIVKKLLSKSYLVTPNLIEAAALCDFAVSTNDSQRIAGERLLDFGVEIALVKGGHGVSDVVEDTLVTHAENFIFQNPRIQSNSTHGTGCTLASAIATGLAQGMSAKAATERAIAYVRKAIETAPGFGKGHGPLNHGHTISSFNGDEQE